MSSPLFSLILLSLFLNERAYASDQNSIRFFSDEKCGNLSFTVHTDGNVGSGTCQALTGIKSVHPDIVDSGCGGTKHL